MQKLLLFALISTAYGGTIEVDINLGKTVEESSVTLFGRSIEPVSETEQKTFKVTPSQLKEYAIKHYGGNPDGCYLDVPTPHGDPWAKFNWDRVKRYLSPRSGEVVELKLEPQVLASKEFKNQSNKTAKYNAAISDMVTDTMQTTWSTSGSFTVGQEINYGVNVGAASVGGSTKLEFTGTFGKDTTKSQTVSVGSTTGVEVELKPGEAVTVSLESYHGSVLFKLYYEASLFGDVVCFYGSPHKGHYIHVFDLYNLLVLTADLPETLGSTEEVKCGYYSEGSIVVRDSETKAVRALYNLDHSSGELQWQLAPEFQLRNGTFNAF